MSNTLISYEEFTKTSEYQGFISVNPKQGTLKVMAFTAYQAIPIMEAEVIITKKIGNDNVLFFRGKTDDSGIIDNISLPAPTSGYDADTFQTASSTTYDLTAIHEKYTIIKKYVINMIGDVKVLQYIKMSPTTNQKGVDNSGN